jgi:hypothetical protein
MSDQTITEPYFETFVMDDEHPTGGCGFVCSECRHDVTVQPCPDHAPTDVPGLALVECEATPRHWAWVHASDANGYGIPCYRCILSELTAEMHDAEARRLRRWYLRWQYWKATSVAAGWAYSLGIVSGYTVSVWPGGRTHSISLRGGRPYVLGVKREVWRCWLIGHHRRGEEVGLGFCGKCLPWPCCGSHRVHHNAGCSEAVTV